MKQRSAHDSALVERLGRLAQGEGLPRIGGRMLGLLAVASEPIASDGLARALRVSRASVSTNAKLLQSLGLVERVTRPGDRRDYLAVRGDAVSVLVTLGLRRLQTMIETVQILRIASGQRTAVLTRIRKMEELYDNLLRRLQLELARQPPPGRRRR